MRKDYYQTWDEAIVAYTKHKNDGFKCKLDGVFPREDMRKYGYRWKIVFE